MNTLRQVFHYLANLEWREKVQHECRFCDARNFQSVVFEDDTVVAIDNIRKAGKSHWLIMPKPRTGPHLRDVEALISEDVPLLEKMDEVKNLLLHKHYPGISTRHVHAGYHRGRRPLAGPIVWPDIVSVHHLHLHVIVQPRFWLCAFKYPAWLPLMWVSDERMMREVRRRRKPRRVGVMRVA